MDGERGPKGDHGQAGDTGNTGVRGNVGERGNIGATGLTGERGPTGDTGQRGISGLKINRGVIYGFVGMFLAFLFAAVLLQRQIATNREIIDSNQQNVARILALEQVNAQRRGQRLADARQADRRLCSEIERLKASARQEALSDYRKLPDFLKLLGLPRTRAIVTQAQRDRDETLRLFKRTSCSTASQEAPSKPPPATPRKIRRRALAPRLGDSVQDLVTLFALSGGFARVIPARKPKRLAVAPTPARIAGPPAAPSPFETPVPPPTPPPPSTPPPPPTTPPSPSPSPSPPPSQSPSPTPEPSPAPAPPSEPGRGRGGRGR